MQISSMDELRGFGAEHRLFDTMTATVARMLHDFLRLSSSAASTTACFHIPQDALVGSLQAPERLIPPNLSIAEVALLISAKHIAEEEKTLNFAIMYERYADHAKRATVSGASSARPFSRAVCLRVRKSASKPLCRAEVHLVAGLSALTSSTNLRRHQRQRSRVSGVGHIGLPDNALDSLASYD